MKHLKEELKDLGLSYDKEANTIFGHYQGYPLYISQVDSGNSKFYNISTTAVRDGQGLSPEACKELKINSQKSLSGVVAKNFKLVATVAGKLTKGKRLETVKTALESLVTYLKDNDYQASCEQTGQLTELDFYTVGGVVGILSQTAYREITKDLDTSQELHNQVSENYLLGTVGAFLGSLLGVAVIVIIAQLGYVAALSGIVMGVVTVKGYEFLGKKFSKVSALICLGLVIAMTYFANELDWALLVARFAEVDLFTAFQGLPELKAQEYIDMSDYSTNLFLLFASTLITAGITIWGALSEQKTRFETRLLSGE